MTQPHEPTDTNRSDVERLAGLGLPIRMIAAFIGIADKTLSKHYELEILRGKAQAGAKVAQVLFDKCMAGDTTALIFYAKTQLGWKETSVQETVSVSNLTDEELDAKISALLNK
jgi:hypothetical protein